MTEQCEMNSDLNRVRAAACAHKLPAAGLHANLLLIANTNGSVLLTGTLTENVQQTPKTT